MPLLRKVAFLMQLLLFAARRAYAFQQPRRAHSVSATRIKWHGGEHVYVHASYVCPLSTLTLPNLHNNNLQSARSSTSFHLGKARTTLSATTIATTTSFSSSSSSASNRRPYHLVIVESPSKCKTISKILEQYVTENDLPYDYVVASSMGHVRDLLKKEDNSGGGSSRPKSKIPGVDINNDYEPTYVILSGKEELVRELCNLAKESETIVMATDEDREGEAIAWHLSELLPKNIQQVRVTFAEITSSAIRQAIESPRSIDLALVEAQETRRIVDRLAGFTMSPILWKKIAPGLSAGRVQSVGMGLIVQRERERLLFQSAEYWDLKALLLAAPAQEAAAIGDSEVNINATMVSLNGVPLATGSDFDSNGTLTKTQKEPLSETDADNLVASLRGVVDPSDSSSLGVDPNASKWTVISIQSKERSNVPPVPFTTSTLQQESNKRLGLSVSQTMQIAQQLYEAGVISYMRTDSTHLSNDAHYATELAIEKDYGSDLVSAQRKTKQRKKSKNAQEAHEAIRPAIQTDGAFLKPDMLTLSAHTIRLYELIYHRTLASRMPSQVLNSTSVEIEGKSLDGDTVALFRTSGSVVVFPGYTLAWGRSTSDTVIPPLIEGQELYCNDLLGVGHSTQPPARYTEASFVKELESLGVGRPSTYASTIKVLRDRAYVGTPLRADDSGQRSSNRKELSGPAISAQRAAGGAEFTGAGRGPLVPSLSAFVVSTLLEKHLPLYIDPEFTAGMEERLDKIARGDGDERRVGYLREFYGGNDGLAAKVQRIDEDVAADEARRANLPALFPIHTEGGVSNDIGLFIGPWGPYVQKLSSGGDSSKKPLSAPLPPGMAADLTTITPQTLQVLLSSREKDGVVLGPHPDDGRDIRLKVGRFGAYLLWGKDDAEGTTTHSLPKHIGGMRNIDNDAAAVAANDVSGYSLSAMIGLSLEDAIGYTGLPRIVCELNELPITAAIGPYGPYLKYNNTYVSLNKKDGDVLTVDSEVAQQVVTDGIINKSGKMGRGVLAEIGEMDGKMILVKDGRFGIYINWKSVNAKMPAEYLETPEELPLEQAWALIQEKVASGGGKKKKTSKTKPALNLPPKPKRPLSAYLHFCAENRKEVSKTAKTLGDVSKELARVWAGTKSTNGDDSGRKKFNDLAAEGKLEYVKKKASWDEACKELLKADGEKSAKKKITGPSAMKGAKMPKRPLSAYLYFCADRRPEVSEKVKTLGEISKELAKIWAETSDDDRKPYHKFAATDKVRYEEECNKNGAPKKATNGGTAGGAAKKTKAKKKKKVANKPPRAPSAYMLFCTDNRKNIVDDSGNKLPFGDTTKELARLWREANGETRTRYEKQAETKKQQLLEESVPF